MTQFAQINIRHQATDPGCKDNRKQDKCQENNQAYHSQVTENQRKKKILKESRGGEKKTTLPVEDQI